MIMAGTSCLSGEGAVMRIAPSVGLSFREEERMNIIIEALEKELILNEKQQQEHERTIAYHQGLFNTFRRIQRMLDDKEDVKKQVKDELATSKMDWKVLMDEEQRLSINTIDLNNAIERERELQERIGHLTIPRK